MSWKAGLSRYLPALRFFACPDSPSSKGVLSWLAKNHTELKLLNPNMMIAIRTTENAMPAVTTELDFTKDHVCHYLLQSNQLSDQQAQAALNYLKFDHEALEKARWSVPGIDPARPGAPQYSEATHYYQLLEERDSYLAAIPQDTYTRAENALLMCQRVDLWCAGESEVERAVQHLYKLARVLNDDRETELPPFIKEFVPGVDPLSF